MITIVFFICNYCFERFAHADIKSRGMNINMRAELLIMIILTYFIAGKTIVREYIYLQDTILN